MLINVQCLPEDYRKMPKHVGGLPHAVSHCIILLSPFINLVLPPGGSHMAHIENHCSTVTIQSSSTRDLCKPLSERTLCNKHRASCSTSPFISQLLCTELCISNNILVSAKKLRLDWAPWRWWQYTPKRIRVGTKMRFGMYSVEHKSWLTDAEPYASCPSHLSHWTASKRLAHRLPPHRTQQTVPWPLIVDVWKRRGGMVIDVWKRRGGWLV